MLSHSRERVVPPAVGNFNERRTIRRRDAAIRAVVHSALEDEVGPRGQLARAVDSCVALHQQVVEELQRVEPSWNRSSE